VRSPRPFLRKSKPWQDCCDGERPLKQAIERLVKIGRRRPPLWLPALDDGRSVSDLYLLGITLLVKRHQRIMPFVGRAADGISNNNDAVAEVDCAQDCCKHANVRFRAAHNEAVSFSALQVLQ
jgi:hypothetical protein